MRTAAYAASFASLRIARGDYAGAESLLLDALKAARLQWGDGSARVRYFDGELVRLYEAWGKPDLAQRYRQGLDAPTAGTAPVHASGSSSDSARRF